MTRTVLAALAALPCILAAAPAGAAGAAAAIRDHVQHVHDRVVPGSGMRVLVAERTSAGAGVEDGTLTVSTGLLAILSSDAQLANVLAYERARLRPETSGGRHGERAAAAAMRAVVAAGYDGREALAAWDRLAAARPLGASAGGYSDPDANRARRKAAARELGRSNQSRKGSGFVAGGEAYREHVLAHLEAWRIRTEGDEPSPSGGAGGGSAPRPGGTDEDASAAWLTYVRSGGIAGRRAEVRVDRDGTVEVTESRAAAPSSRAALTPAERQELEALVARSLALPARVAKPELPYLRDGFVRSLEVRGEDGSARSLQLSEGYRLEEPDHLLVRWFEEHAR